MCVLIATSAASKYFRSDRHSFESSDWDGDKLSDGYDVEEWPVETDVEPLKPIKAWPEPIIVHKKVPVYVPGM